MRSLPAIPASPDYPRKEYFRAMRARTTTGGTRPNPTAGPRSPRAALPARTGTAQPCRKWSWNSMIPWSSIERTRNDVGCSML